MIYKPLSTSLTSVVPQCSTYNDREEDDHTTARHPIKANTIRPPPELPPPVLPPPLPLVLPLVLPLSSLRRCALSVPVTPPVTHSTTAPATSPVCCAARRAVTRVPWVHTEPARRGRRRDGRYVYRSPAMIGTPCCTTSPSVGRTRARYEAHMRPALTHRGRGRGSHWRGWGGGRQKRRRMPSTAVTSRIHRVAACNMGSSRRWRVGSPPPPPPSPRTSPCISVGGGIRYLPKRRREDPTTCPTAFQNSIPKQHNVLCWVRVLAFDTNC